MLRPRKELEEQEEQEREGGGTHGTDSGKGYWEVTKSEQVGAAVFGPYDCQDKTALPPLHIHWTSACRCD